MFGKVAKGVGGVLMGTAESGCWDPAQQPLPARDWQPSARRLRLHVGVEAQLESLLHQISDSRHAGDRRDGMSRLKELVQSDPQVSLQGTTAAA
jgi:hypothetical protein